MSKLETLFNLTFNWTKPFNVQHQLGIVSEFTVWIKYGNLTENISFIQNTLQLQQLGM